MPNQHDEIAREDLVPGLWDRYTRTSSYRHDGRTFSISAYNPIVRAAEEKGLNKMIRLFIRSIEHTPDIRTSYIERSRGDWIGEWLLMNKTLLKYLLKERGRFRPLGMNVRFGSPGDEDLHRIPRGGPDTTGQIYELADSIGARIRSVDPKNIDATCSLLAYVHYQFVRIHPFPDGNGRIARAITDQIAVCLGYPPILAGFPRTQTEKRIKYHAAITGCATDPMCRSLSQWIKTQLEERIESIA